MRHLAGGATVITAGVGDDRTGLTATTATSLALEPPTMLIQVNRKASSYSAIKRHGFFCINVLASHQQRVAENFTGANGVTGLARYVGAGWSTLATGAAALDGAIANVDCQLEESIERLTHALFIGKVVAVRLGDVSESALVYHRGRFGAYP